MERTGEEQYESGKNLYSFDSHAENTWANVLDKAVQSGYVKRDSTGTIFLFGKNYESVGNSEVYFEYYDGTVKKSFPDFILKNQHDSVHIFESKSFNKSGKFHLNDKAYRHKVDALLNAYQHASILTGYHFYIPIMKGASWTIWWCCDGKMKQITETDVLENIKTM